MSVIGKHIEQSKPHVPHLNTQDALALCYIPYGVVCPQGWARDWKEFCVETSMVSVSANTDAECSFSFSAMPLCSLSAPLFSDH